MQLIPYSRFGADCSNSGLSQYAILGYRPIIWCGEVPTDNSRSNLFYCSQYYKQTKTPWFNQQL